MTIRDKIILSFILLLLLIASGCASPQVKRTNPGEEKPRMTIEQLRERIALDPRDASARFELGKRLAERGNYQEAISFLETAHELGLSGDGLGDWLRLVRAKLELMKNHYESDPYFQLGDIYYNREDYPKTLENLQKAIELGQNDVKTYKLLGMTYWQLGDFDKSAEAFKSALDIDSNDGDVANWLEFIEVEIALKKNPDDKEAYFKLGNIYYYDESYNEAISEYKRVLEYDSQHQQARRMLGKAQRALEGDELIDKGNVEYDEADYEEAIKLYKRAGDIFEEIRNNKALIRSSGGVGNAYYMLNKYPQALEYYNRALRAARRAKYREGEADQLNNLGNVHYSLSNYDEANKYHLKALSISRQIGYRWGESDQLSNVASIYASLGKYPLALKYYQQALQIAQEIEDRYREINRLSGLGWVYYRLADYSTSIEYHKRALKLAEAIEDRYSQANSLNDLGNIYSDLGDYPQSLEYYEKGLQLSQDISAKDIEASLLNNLGNLYSDRGDYTPALDCYNQAIAIAHRIGDRGGEALYLGNIGLSYMELGDYEKALQYQQEALEIDRETGAKFLEGAVLDNIGLIYYLQGKLDLAKDYFEGSVKILDQLGSKREFAFALTDLAQIYYELKDYKRALELHQEALATSQEIGNKVNVANVLNHLGETYQALGDLEDAQKSYEESLNICKELGVLSVMWQSQSNLGMLQELKGDKEKAIAYYKEAIDTIESIRGRLKSKELQAGFMKAEDKIDVYERLINLAIELESPEKCLEYLERSKSEVIKEIFAGLKPKIENEYARERFEQISELEGRIEATEKQLAQATSEEEIENLTQVLAKTKGEVNQLMLELDNEHPEVYNFLTVHYTTFDIIQEQLPDNTLLIEYGLLDDYFLIFTISKDSIVAKSVKVCKDEIDNLVIDYRRELRRPLLGSEAGSEAPIEELSSKLYGYLILPIEEEIEKFDTITIVPYGSLYYLPFHALQRKLPSGELQYLLEWKRVAYLTSSTLMDLLKGGSLSRGMKESLIAFGNPDGTLKSALEEVEALGKIVSEAEIFTLEDATKDKFLTYAKDYNIIHLATHGYLKPNPKNSYLVLAPKGEGNLTVWEIMGELTDALKDENQLVVLSACQTALQEGKQLQGKELLSLASAFTRAGSPALIATLWSVDDKSTKELMLDFYENLRDGNHDKLEALRQAQISLLGSGKFDHPFFWAPFILIGDWR